MGSRKSRFYRFTTMMMLVAALMAAALFICASCSSDMRPWGEEYRSSESSAIATDDGYTLQEAGKLKVAASLDYAPFEYEAGYQTVGFTYELMGKIAEKMGLELEYVSSPSQDRVVAAVEGNNKVDLGASSLEPTSAIKSRVALSDSYLDLKTGVSARRDSEYTGLTDLAGKAVGVVKDTTSAAWARKNLKDSIIVEYDSWTLLFANLQSYNVEAAVSSLEVARYYLRVQYTNEQVIYQGDSSERFVFAASKDNEALLQVVNSALDDLKADGTYQALYDSWFYETEVDRSGNYIIPPQSAPFADKAA